MKPHTVCMLAAFLFVLMVNIVTAQNATAQNATARDATTCGADCKCCRRLYAYAQAKIDELYINEREYPVNQNGVTSALLKCCERVGIIAIRASCPAGSDCNCALAGLKASVEHERVFTSRFSWKCTTQIGCRSCKWMNYYYNDARWPRAVEYKDFPAGPKPISWYARWIWTRRNGWFNVDRMVYCRGKYRGWKSESRPAPTD